MKTLSNLVDQLIAYFHIAVRWVLFSSADPEKASATVKFALMLAVPYLIKAGALACGAGLACLSVLNSAFLTDAVALLANVAYWVFGLVGAVGAAWGFVRKVQRTATGNNLALSPTEAQ